MGGKCPLGAVGPSKPGPEAIRRAKELALLGGDCVGLFPGELGRLGWAPAPEARENGIFPLREREVLVWQQVILFSHLFAKTFAKYF